MRKKSLARKAREANRIYHQKYVAPKITLHKLDWLEWISVALFLWLFLYPQPYTLLMSIALVLPILGLMLNGVSKPSLASLVSISGQHGDDKYDLADFIQFPGIILAIRVLADFEFESFYSIVKVGTVAFTLLLILLFATHKQIEKSNHHKGVIYLMLVANIALYSYAGTYAANCVYDSSEAKVYEANVIDKSFSTGRAGKWYYLKVEPWGHYRDPEKIRVSKSKYEATEIGATVTIDYKEGFLRIPWYYVQ